MSATREWQVQEAKDKLSEVVRCAREEGPQMVTTPAEEAVMIVATDVLSRPKRETLYAFMMRRAKRHSHGDIAPPGRREEHVLREGVAESLHQQ